MNIKTKKNENFKKKFIKRTFQKTKISRNGNFKKTEIKKKIQKKKKRIFQKINFQKTVFSEV